MAEERSNVPTGIDLDREQADRVRNRMDQIDEERAARGFAVRHPNKQWVKPSGQFPVPDGGGGFFGPDAIEVDVNDIYMNRRIRDGSMLVVHGPDPVPPPVEPAPPPADLTPGMAMTQPPQPGTDQPPQEKTPAPEEPSTMGPESGPIVEEPQPANPA
jgi:hypothetical protein